MRILNNLGAIAALGGDRTGAKSLYESAAVLAGDSPELASDREVIEKNLNTLGTHR
jgi:Flp pilus assembly protein TadD